MSSQRRPYTKFTVRPMTRDDVNYVLALEFMSGNLRFTSEAPYGKKAFIAALKKPRESTICLLAIRRETVLAFTIADLRGKYAHVRQFVSDPNQQTACEELLDRLEDAAQEHGCRQLTLYIKSSQRRMRTYLRMVRDFVEIQTLKLDDRRKMHLLVLDLIV